MPFAKPPFLAISKLDFVSDAGHDRAWLKSFVEPPFAAVGDRGMQKLPPPLATPPKRWLALRFPLVAADPPSRAGQCKQHSRFDDGSRRAAGFVERDLRDPANRGDKRRDIRPRPSTKAQKNSLTWPLSRFSFLKKIAGSIHGSQYPACRPNNTPNNSAIIILMEISPSRSLNMGGHD